MNTKRNILYKLPAVLYGWGVSFRNFLYDTGLKGTYKSSIPTICVGNLSVGGSGKTPHIELLIKLLHSRYKLAILTRGYKRKLKGQIFAQPSHTAYDIGDEPMLYAHRYPNITILIDSDRQRGLKTLEALPEEDRPEVILMDDGFQHRRVKPAYSILLTRFDHPFTRDSLMPYGTLREHAYNKDRADTVIVTSTPDGIKPIDFRLLKGELDLRDHQDVYFSRILYNQPIRIFGGEGDKHIVHSHELILLSGIANPSSFVQWCKEHYHHIITHFNYPDHHYFNDKDIEEIISTMEEHSHALLLCTEKDAYRLYCIHELLPTEIKRRLFALPIHVELSQQGTQKFLQKIELAIKNNGLEI